MNTPVNGALPLAPRLPLAPQRLGIAMPEAHADGQALAAALDAVDYGVIVVDTDLNIRHMNRVARHRLRRSPGLCVAGHQLRAEWAPLGERLHAAVAAAALRSVRSTLTVDAQLRMAVVPCHDAQSAVLVLSRAQVCGRLALEALAREHRLTSAETSVLVALCEGEAPEQIAQRHGVALCTVRTQVLQTRSKLGARSTREMLAMLAHLPPLVPVVAE